MDAHVAELIDVLGGYDHLNSDHDIIPDVLYPVRLAFQDDPTQKSIYGQHALFWTSLSRVWADLTVLLVDRSEESVVRPITSMAYFLASICAGVQQNQSQAMIDIEPHLTRILVYASSFSNLEDETYTAMTRACCQAMSNMIANNPTIAQEYLPRKLEREAKYQMFLRLLASSDSIILEAVLSILLNLIAGDQRTVSSFVMSRAGISILDRILILVDVHFDVDDPEGLNQAQPSSFFSLSFKVAEQIIDQGSFPIAYHAQASSDTDFVISSPQVVLLKFLDGYLQLPSPMDRPKDARDAAAFQGLVLTLQCIITIGLASEKGRAVSMNSIVEEIVSLLALCDAIVPKPVITDLEEIWIEPAASAQLKRCLVQILGILSADSKDAQDRIRESGGLALLLGLCQINDANPTLREHAMFSIRNILNNNRENQEMIENLKPQYRVGETGELHDLPPAMR